MNRIRTIFLITIITSTFAINSNAQEEEKKDYGIKISGYIKNDFILDTRQTVSVREGHFLLYPSNIKLDGDGKDVNDRASFNYLAIQTRLKGVITGPDAFGAKTSGVIEGAFFGHADSDINGFRLRHAFLKLNWSTTELLMGQYWHMMFNPGCFPGTVSFNTGVPFQYFSRNPQIRITQSLGNIKLAGAVATQRDFAAPGGSASLRNALLPDMQGQISYNAENMLVGLGAGYKRLLPEIATDSSYKANEAVGGFSGQAFFKYKTSPVTIKLEGAFAQNGYDGLFIGGYAVKSIKDPLRDINEYTPINTLACWTDIHTNGKIFQAGLFVGYTQNLGSFENIQDLNRIKEDESVRGYNIAYAYRVSPRIIVNSGKVRFAAELEHTTAAYGSTLTNKAVPKNTKEVTNNRILVAAYYFF